MSNLLDKEILKIREIQMDLNRRFAMMPRTEATIDEIEKEAVWALAEEGWLAHVQAFPLLQGEPMIIELIQRIEGPQEFDHEQKQWEVLKADEKGEYLHGESKSEAPPAPENI